MDMDESEMYVEEFKEKDGGFFRKGKANYQIWIIIYQVFKL